jgi:hypothetical protein
MRASAISNPSLDRPFGDGRTGVANLTGAGKTLIAHASPNSGKYWYFLPYGDSWIGMGSLNGTNGFRFGPMSNDAPTIDFGDFNHDGTTDVILGDGDYNNNTGAAWILWGRNNFFSVGSQVTEAAASQYGTQFNGVHAGDYAGYEVAPWDADHDGTPDAVICAPDASYYVSIGGSCYVYWGKPANQWSGTPAVTAPTLQNGNFESPNLGGGNNCGSPTGWTPAGVNGGWAGSCPQGAYGCDPSAVDGVQVGNFWKSGTLSQTLNFTQGGTFTLSFSYTHTCTSSSPTLYVQVDGNTVLTVYPNSNGWQTATATFTVTAGSHTITFNNSDDSGGNTNIDAVSLNSVASWNGVNLSDIDAAAAR